MTIDLLPTAGYWVAAIATVAVVGVALSVGSVTEFFVHNRAIRINRDETIPAYYRGLVLAS